MAHKTQPLFGAHINGYQLALLVRLIHLMMGPIPSLNLHCITSMLDIFPLHEGDSIL